MKKLIIITTVVLLASIISTLCFTAALGNDLRMILRTGLMHRMTTTLTSPILMMITICMITIKAFTV